MSQRQLKNKSRSASFAWQYAFHARLVYAGAPMSKVHLISLGQAVHAFRGHLDPIVVADEILLTWPFDVTEWGGLP